MKMCLIPHLVCYHIRPDFQIHRFEQKDFHFILVRIKSTIQDRDKMAANQIHEQRSQNFACTEKENNIRDLTVTA